MEQESSALQMQQRMLLRSIADIQRQVDRALFSGLKHDFQLLEEASQTFKEFVNQNIQAPEIRDYIRQIPQLNPGSSEPSILKVMMKPAWWLSSGNQVKANHRLMHLGSELRSHYANLQVLVMMMEED